MAKNLNLKKVLPIAALVVLVAVAAYFVLWYGRVSTDNAYIKADITLVSPKVTGYVKEVRITDNQPVKAGDLLVVIEQQDYAAKVAGAQAQVEALQGQIAEQAQAIAQATAQSDVAWKNNKRAQALQLQGAIANQNADEAKAQNKSEKAILEGAKSHLDVLNAQLKQAQANLELATIDLSSTQIIAPQAGIIGNRTVQVGQLVRPGAALAYLIPQKMWVEANFKETQLEDMRAGQLATISVDALGGKDVQGRVLSFAPASGAEFSILPPENATGNFTKVVRRVPVKILIETDAETAKLLRPGLSVVVTVDTRTTPPLPAEEQEQPMIAASSSMMPVVASAAAGVTPSVVSEASPTMMIESLAAVTPTTVSVTSPAAQ